MYDYWIIFMQTITLYRAMCPEEYQKTIQNQSFAWKNKAKFFSDKLDFIIHRVQDGKFSNSTYKKEKYQHLVKFHISLIKNHNPFVQVSNNEFMLNVRKQSLVKIVHIETLPPNHIQ